MSYQVLARQYRPQSLTEVKGQETTVRILRHTLETKRLHHAYLFSGTRGIGKTTFGRLLAKCLNCETGITPDPCNQCHTCEAITNNRFIDLVEVDAASRTKVEDTRELLENVPYAPTLGRFKIYLIDEVHMLSNHSFNALLKTLEEPPDHIKFILATTDPQKIPPTVVSRCLQFHLKPLSQELINEQLAYVLEKESIRYEPNALRGLAKAAEGSMRDALSLLDYAIGYCQTSIDTSSVQTLLGEIQTESLVTLIKAIVKKEANTVYHTLQKLFDAGADFEHALNQLLELLYYLSLAKTYPEVIDSLSTLTLSSHELSVLADSLSAQALQLCYQIALTGKRDLVYAPSPRIGFEMILLRMMAFTPRSMHFTPEKFSDDKKLPKIPEKKILPWPELLLKLNLSGLTHSLATHCVLEKIEKGVVFLQLEKKHQALFNSTQQVALQRAFTNYFEHAHDVKVNITTNRLLKSPSQLQQESAAAKQADAEKIIQADPDVQRLLSEFNGKVLEVSSLDKD